jgi:hypothetical protein
VQRFFELLNSTSFVVVNGATLALILAVLLLGIHLAARAKRVQAEIERSIAAIQSLSLGRGLALLNDLESRFPKGIGFTEQWSEFREGVVELPDGSCLNSLPFGNFVRDDVVLATVGSRRFKFPLIHALPGICTSLGILGTFVGITIGLWGVDASNPADGIQPLISGLSTAFLTSIVGVIMSMILGVWAGHRESRLLASVHDFVDLVEQKVPRITSEKLLASLLDAERARAVDHSRLGGEIVDALKHQITVQTLLRNDAVAHQATLLTLQGDARRSAELLQSLVGDQKSAIEIHRQGREQTEEQLQILENIRLDMTESRANLQTIANDLADKIGNRMEQSFSAVLGPQLQRMSEVVKSQMTHVASSNSDQARRFADEMVQQLTGTLGGAIGGMSEQIGLATRSFDNLSSTMYSIIENAKTAVEEQRRAFAESGSVVERANEAARFASQEVTSLHELAGRFNRLTEIVEASQTRAMSLHEQQLVLHTNTAEQTEKLTHTLGAANRSYEATAEEFGRLFPTLLHLTQKFQSSVGELAAASSGVTEAISQSTRSLRERAADEKQLLDQFRQAADAFGGAFQQAAPALTGLERASAELAQQRQSATAVLERLGALAKGLDGTNMVVQQGLKQAETSLANAARRIAEAIQSTETWTNSTSNSVQTVGARIHTLLEDSLKEYDKSLAAAVTSFASTLRELDDLAEEIRAGAQQRRSHG